MPLGYIVAFVYSSWFCEIKSYAVIQASCREAYDVDNVNPLDNKIMYKTVGTTSTDSRGMTFVRTGRIGKGPTASEDLAGAVFMIAKASGTLKDSLVKS